MANNMLSLRLPEYLEKECESLCVTLGYTSVQELIREAIRDKILTHKRELAWQQIQNLPLQKGKKLTLKKKEDLAKEFENSASKRLV